MNKRDYMLATPAMLQQMIDDLTTRMSNGVFNALLPLDRARFYSRLGALHVLKTTWDEQWQHAAAEMCEATDELR